MPVTVILTRADREPAHNNGWGAAPQNVSTSML